MGKKQKIGKQRQDKFYHLAKETGYRSRAAFKLIQLNRKHEFLQKSRVLIDLCAAPGGWLQVAKQNMPVSSVIIGIDLVPIKPIPNVLTLEEDITTDKCQQALKKHLKTWKADVVLHDGAPNLGKNWLHDAFQQAQLTMHALKLTTSFLTKGGWFITKVFRSKDYHALLWVFKQFFKKVHATKPQASRTESAEIFVVCQNYLAPDKIDPKLLDSKYIFEEVESEPKTKLNLMFPEKDKHRPEGYPEGATTLFNKIKVSEFIRSSNFVELLNNCNELAFDEEKYENHKFTTQEIKACCKDIKVLGRRELRLLLSWRKKLHEEFYPKQMLNPNETVEEFVQDEEDAINHMVEQAEIEETQELKRKKKKILKEKRKLNEKLNLKMVLPDDEPIVSEDKSLFQLQVIKNKKDLAKVKESNLRIFDGEIDNDPDEIAVEQIKTISYDKDSKNLNGIFSDESETETDDDIHGDINDSEDEASLRHDDQEKEGNPLLVDLDNDPLNIKKKKKMDFWFEKDIFHDLENTTDETYEINQIAEYFQKKINTNKEIDVKKKEMNENKERLIKNVSEDSEPTKTEDKEVYGSIQCLNASKKRKKTLDGEGLALGTMMIYSKKKKRDIIDDSWNRYTFNDDNIPQWFKTDEDKHNKKQIPVSKEMIQEFKEKLKEINARPIKKIAEAKARKKRKMAKKMEKARKKAEQITSSNDMSEVEKRHQVKVIYKRLMPNKQNEVTYVVAKKSTASKRVRRPAGVKGRFKVVDPRMKKDHLRGKEKGKRKK